MASNKIGRATALKFNEAEIPREGGRRAAGFIKRAREVAFVAKPDRNADVDKSRAFNGNKAAPMHIIDTAGAFGGLLEAFEVLDAGGAVGLMGDRCLEADSVPVQFFGKTARFPVAAFFLAAKAHAPVVPFFLTRGNSRRELQIEFGTVVRPQRPAHVDLRRWRRQSAADPYRKGTDSL